MFNEKIKGNLGFGCMRLPMINKEEKIIDKDEFCRMTDAFMDAGFNYFDTAYGYIDGKSELAVRDCLTSRHDRESYVLADKLSYWCFEKEEDVLPLFEKQLERCGVEYFDLYLFHCMNHEGYEKHKRCNTFEIVKKLKDEGKIKHIGMSFHDTADYLDMILTEQPYMEFVQLQLNYLDYDDPTVQSKACYDVAVKHGKKVIVMEPVKGGALADLPADAAKELRKLGDASQASYALRYAATFPAVFMVLSGMGDMKMMNDNVNTFKNFVPITEKDVETFDKVREIVRKVKQIPCTRCNYCADVCPSGIPISEIFFIYNKLMGAKISRSETKELLVPYREKINECIKCGKCETNCPQSIEIRERLEKINKLVND
ncbi:MAG: aldo/keto reductase [Clostridia bacterium]|nr:aldo/keto reductase [Clostridia bacterium]